MSRRNDWGNLGRHVAWRHDPCRTGIVVDDMGEHVWIAESEDGWSTLAQIRDLVGVGSPAHEQAGGIDESR